MTEPVLQCDGVTKRFGAITAVSGVDFELPAGHTKSLIGPNGAGKTTLLNCICGILSPTEGKIVLEGDNITNFPPYDRVKQGLGKTYQVTTLFNEFTAFENIRLALQCQAGESLEMWRRYDRNPQQQQEAIDMLSKIGLEEEVETPVSALSHGQKRQLEIGVALATKPKVLLMDEPTAGVSSENLDQISNLIKSIQEDVSIILVEHNIDVVMDISDSIMVMDQGELIADDEPAVIRNDKRVRDAYLGTSEELTVDEGL